MSEAEEASGPVAGRAAPAVKVTALAAVLFALGLLVLRTVHLGLSPLGGLGTLALAAMFAVTEIAVLHVQVRREAQTISLNEIPLVFGLRFVPVPGLLAARLLGSLLVFVLHLRQRPLAVGPAAARPISPGACPRSGCSDPGTRR